MKAKICLPVVVVLLMSISQSCLIIRKPAAMFGVERSSVESKDEDSWKGGTGVQAGFSIPIAELNEMMSIRAGVNLSLQSPRWEGSYSKGKSTFLYANVPLVFRYQLKNGFFGEAGIQPGLLLMAKEKGSNSNQNYNDNVLKYYKKLDLGIPFGVGYEFKNNFGVGLRVIPGLASIYSDSNSKARNLVIALRGTYTFNLNKK